MEIRREHIRLGLTADLRRQKYGKDGPEPDSLTPDATAMLNDINASTWWIPMTIQLAVVSGSTESWGLKLLRYLLCLQGSDTEEKESRSSVTSSPNDKQIDPALWLWQSKQG